MKGERRAAYDAAKRYAALFGKNNFYVEIEGHLLPEDRHLCLQLVDLADVLGLETVVTNNVHYATRAEHILHDVLTCIRHRVPLDRSAPFRRLNSEFYLKGEKEVMELPWLPREAIVRTGEVAGRCLFDLDFSSFSYPRFPLPEGETATAFLRRLATEKARARYGSLTEELLRRIEDEILLIEEKGLSGYFLVVRDIVEHARKVGISAQGRGSAASSVVAYVLGITPVDPMKHKLFVGRFLNELSIPDIDIDIATNRREEVIQYSTTPTPPLPWSYLGPLGRVYAVERSGVGHVLTAGTALSLGGAAHHPERGPEFASYLDPRLAFCGLSQ